MLYLSDKSRYIGIYADFAKTNVIWDFAMGDFCTLPDERGAMELLTFDHQLGVIKWLSMAQDRGLDMMLPDDFKRVPCPELWKFIEE